MKIYSVLYGGPQRIYTFRKRNFISMICEQSEPQIRTFIPVRYAKYIPIIRAARYFVILARATILLECHPISVDLPLIFSSLNNIHRT